ncbi:MAG: CehA/McbA family metallohydrolase [Acidobacteriaceae bacterium]|nr:CehA/McbA family metallohydrolase [Acidobacteriaceae bacterium]
MRSSLQTLPTRLLRLRAFLPAFVILAASFAIAQREPVLKQIDLPHRYYYREMYLPQLTTGPSSAAWSSDSRSLIYSMAGTLWRQGLDSGKAEQLTAGPGYDYQPDCSPDGHWVVYTTYLHDAMELWVLDLEKRQSHPLTSDGAVNIEPRFSPDGKRLAFVSTSYNRHFHIFIANFSEGQLSNVRRLTGESRSNLPRFYYSEFDHEISPTWSPDGADLIFVSNRGHVYGTGGLWRMKAEPGAEAREIHYEETAWKARPDFSPDGRVVYASYLGGQWHQLWLMPSQGGDPFPISYGDFDNTNPRWSPDGTHIVFISNRGGNTSLWVQEVLGGAQRQMIAEEKHYLKPMGELTVTVLDASGKITPARISITGEDARAYAPDSAWMHAEDNFVRSESAFESHYFHSPGMSEITVPRGRIQVEVMKGFEYQVARETVICDPNARLVVRLKPLRIPEDTHSQWASADLHVHMNYGGTYRNTPAHLVQQQTAENLFLVEDLVVNKEQRIPDIAYFRTTPDSASTPDHWLLYGQEFHTTYWGHLGLLNLTQNFLLPDYASYANTAAASLFPTNAAVADLAHKQYGVVGYVHPFDIAVDPTSDPTLTHREPLDEALELPVDAALGKVDYVEVLGFSDHRLTASIWYRLLNCGFRLPAGAGSDTMANYASARGPVGLTRVYAAVPSGGNGTAQWLDSLTHGRTFATNGPLLGFTLAGKTSGDELRLPAGENKLEFTSWLRSFVPVDHLELICNGQVIRDLKLNNDRQSADVKGAISLSQSGWCVLRASSDNPEHPVLDDYVYATTSPIYIRVAGSAVRPQEDARYFIAWIERLVEAATASQNWNTTEEKLAVLQSLDRARQIYTGLLK